MVSFEVHAGLHPPIVDPDLWEAVQQHLAANRRERSPDRPSFAADGDGARLAVAAVALQATTLGIPCIYYGTEQGFDGAGGNDRYIREAMFASEVGRAR